MCSYTAFLLSVRRGYLNSAKRLAVLGADMTCRTKNGLDSIALAFEFPRTRDWLQSVRDYTPLHVAVDLLSYRHTKRLLRQGTSLLHLDFPATSTLSCALPCPHTLRLCCTCAPTGILTHLLSIQVQTPVA
jgi:hypothetical protein